MTWNGIPCSYTLIYNWYEIQASLIINSSKYTFPKRINLKQGGSFHLRKLKLQFLEDDIRYSKVGHLWERGSVNSNHKLL